MRYRAPGIWLALAAAGLAVPGFTQGFADAPANGQGLRAILDIQNALNTGAAGKDTFDGGVVNNGGPNAYFLDPVTVTAQIFDNSGNKVENMMDTLALGSIICVGHPVFRNPTLFGWPAWGWQHSK